LGSGPGRWSRLQTLVLCNGPARLGQDADGISGMGWSRTAFRIAEAYSSGKMIVEVLQEYVKSFSKVCSYLESVKDRFDEKE
jgi:hypothetical protein